MGGIIGGGDPAPVVTPLPPPPTISDAEVQDAALKARQRAARASGRSSTILTSGQGVGDETTSASTQLLGEG